MAGALDAQQKALTRWCSATQPWAAAEKGSRLSQYQPIKFTLVQLRVAVGRMRGRFGLSAGYQSFFGATTFQLAQHKPRQTWHPDASLERPRLRLGEWAEPRLVDAEWSDEEL